MADQSRSLLFCGSSAKGCYWSERGTRRMRRRRSMCGRRASAVRRYVSAMRDATDGARERLMVRRRDADHAGVDAGSEDSAPVLFQVALRVRPLRPGESSRVLHVVDDKVRTNKHLTHIAPVCTATSFTPSTFWRWTM